MTNKTALRAALYPWLVAPAMAMAGPVSVGGNEWMQVVDTVNNSYNDFAGVCDTASGACSGSVGATNLDGWTWASIEDVAGLFSELTPHTGDRQNGEAFEVDSAWAPAFLSLFNPTYSVLGDALVTGVTRTESSYNSNSALLADIIDSAQGYYDQALTTSTTLKTTSADSFGGWFYREQSLEEDIETLLRGLAGKDDPLLVLGNSEVIANSCTSGRASAEFEEACNNLLEAAAQGQVGVNTALREITPEKATEGNVAVRQNNRVQNQNIGERLAALRGGARGASIADLDDNMDEPVSSPGTFLEFTADLLEPEFAGGLTRFAPEDWWISDGFSYIDRQSSLSSLFAATVDSANNISSLLVEVSRLYLPDTSSLSAMGISDSNAASSSMTILVTTTLQYGIGGFDGVLSSYCIGVSGLGCDESLYYLSTGASAVQITTAGVPAPASLTLLAAGLLLSGRRLRARGAGE